MRALLDINVLIALLDAGHVHHQRAHRWLDENIDQGWASCPITQNGCIRIMSQPAYPGSLPAQQVAARLAEATRHPSHAFWADSLSLAGSESVDWSVVITGPQITDAYLLCLAVANDGRFVTFDRGISHAAAKAARAEQLVLL